MYCGTYESGRGTFSVSTLWKIAPPSKYYPISVFNFMLKEEPWDSEPFLGEVLKRQEGKHWERAMKSDLRFAVICSPEFWICDGCHRFVKAKHLGKTQLRARVFPTRDAMLPALQTRTSTDC